jgi:hypothetical protein
LWKIKSKEYTNKNFRKEIKKVEQSRRSGSSIDDIYVPSLWYYDLLIFTIDQELQTNRISNLDSPGAEYEGKDGSETAVEDICGEETCSEELHGKESETNVSLCYLLNFSIMI